MEDERREDDQPEPDEETEQEAELLPPREAMSTIDLGGTLGPPPLTE